MIWTRLRNHRTTHRIDAVNELQFPASGRQRLGNQHPQLSGDDIRLVEAATRQWFRLVARNPGAKMSMPSVVVDELWQEMTRHASDYAAFCDAAFGHLLHRPAVAISADTTPLLATLGYARQDEGGSPTALPLLFRVDQNLRIQNGNRYLADCGGRGECFRAPGLTCLQHLTGPGKAISPAGIRGGWFTLNRNYGPYHADVGGLYGDHGGGSDGGAGD